MLPLVEVALTVREAPVPTAAVCAPGLVSLGALVPVICTILATEGTPAAFMANSM